jgi:hypothetical protein
MPRDAAKSAKPAGKRGKSTQTAETLWTVEETASYLRKPVSTLHRLRSRSDPPYGPLGRKVGRHVLYDADEVRAWFARDEDEGAS